MPTPLPTLTVVGIGEDGWDGLSGAARRAITAAELVIGSSRQLALVEDHTAATELWPSDIAAAVATLDERHPGRRLVVLASGDPLHYGVAGTVTRILGPDRVTVVPHPSSVSLACARLGWPVQSVAVLSAVARPLAALHPLLHPGARILVLTTGEDGAAQLARRVATAGYPARFIVLERLGGPAERVLDLSLEQAQEPGFRHDRLAIVAIECGSNPRALGRTPGLSDEAFETDGVHTKAAVRAVTLAALRPLPGQLLWDVGAGSGTVAVEWCRSDPGCRALAVEPREDRRTLIEANAERLGVPGVQVVAGRAPEALVGLPSPDAVFVGGGATTPGLIEACLDALAPGGRLVVNAVTVESEGVLAHWWSRTGGELHRLQFSEALPLAGQHTFRPALPITQWSYVRPADEPTNGDST